MREHRRLAKKAKPARGGLLNQTGLEPAFPACKAGVLTVRRLGSLDSSISMMQSKHNIIVYYIMCNSGVGTSEVSGKMVDSFATR